MTSPILREADSKDSAAISDLISELGLFWPAFTSSAQAVSSTTDILTTWQESGVGLVVNIADTLIGCLLATWVEDRMVLNWVGTLPQYQPKETSDQLIRAAMMLGAAYGAVTVEARIDSEVVLPGSWWHSHGFEKAHRDYLGNIVLVRPLPTRVVVPTAEDMRILGRKLASQLEPGDLLIATGDLGAGKTTFAQGIGEGLGVAERVISPTFVISRIHHNSAGPDLVHVDAYRLNSAAELEDIDLELSQPRSVTLIEWGQGISEWLAEQRLEIDIVRSDDPDDETREVYLTGYGARWNTGALEGF